MASLPMLNPVDAVLTQQMRREAIGAFEAFLADQPDAVFGNTDTCPLIHHFAPGVYVREIRLPKGTVLTSKIHREAEVFMILQGTALMVTEQGGREVVAGPFVGVSVPGVKRALYILEDTIWVTCHPNRTNTQDIAALEAEIIVPSYKEVTP